MATVEEKIVKLKEKVADLEKKKNSIDSKLKEAKNELAILENQQNIAKLSRLTAEMSKKGLSYEDLLLALSNSDMLSLQEKIESGENQMGEADLADGVSEENGMSEDL